MKRLTILVLCLWLRNAVSLNSKNFVAESLKNYEPDIEPYEERFKPSKTLLNYRRNGLKIDVRVVPVTNVTITNNHLPEFPARDLGLCLLNFSMKCLRDRMARFVDSITRLDEIALWGSSVKFVKTKSLPKDRVESRMLNDGDSGEKIDRSIENFFDSFALRISLPRSRGRREKSELNQIDVTLDDTDVFEGRGKKGGGGGKGGGKCKKMMMMMIGMGKMKLMAWAGMMSMKGMLMSGMSLMISKAMLIMKLMSLKMGKGGGGGGGGGGGYGGGGGGQLKEIVLLTKAPGGGGGGPSDSYGAPPASSYGPPSSGGGGYDYSGGGGGGGGWGRSFSNRVSTETSSNPKIIYPTINASNSYQNTYDIQPVQEFNNSSSTKREMFSQLNDSALWNDWKFWNPTSDTIQIKKPSIRGNLSTSNDNELVTVERKNPSEKITDESILTLLPTNYAKKWKNYEIADRIISPGTRIIGIKRISNGRASISIPTGE